MTVRKLVILLELIEELERDNPYLLRELMHLFLDQHGHHPKNHFPQPLAATVTVTD